MKVQVQCARHFKSLDGTYHRTAVTPHLIMSSFADILKFSILGSESIHVGFHLLPYIFHTIIDTLPSSTYALITDTNLSKIYLSDIQEEFNEAAQAAGSKARFMVYEVAPGEGAKEQEGQGGYRGLAARCKVYERYGAARFRRWCHRRSHRFRRGNIVSHLLSC